MFYSQLLSLSPPWDWDFIKQPELSFIPHVSLLLSFSLLYSGLFLSSLISQSLAFHLFSVFQEFVGNSCPLMPPSPLFFVILCRRCCWYLYPLITSKFPIPSFNCQHLQFLVCGFCLVVWACSACPWLRLEVQNIPSHQPSTNGWQELVSKYPSFLAPLLE